MTTKTNRKRQIERLDIAWSKMIRQRDGHCLRCGKDFGLEAAHIFTRQNMSTRYDPDNGVTFCRADCHKWGHARPAEFQAWAREHLGVGKFAELEAKTRTLFHVDLDAIEYELRAYL